MHVIKLLKTCRVFLMRWLFTRSFTAIVKTINYLSFFNDNHVSEDKSRFIVILYKRIKSEFGINKLKTRNNRLDSMSLPEIREQNGRHWCEKRSANKGLLYWCRAQQTVKWKKTNNCGKNRNLMLSDRKQSI